MGQLVAKLVFTVVALEVKASAILYSRHLAQIAAIWAFQFRFCSCKLALDWSCKCADFSSSVDRHSEFVESTGFRAFCSRWRIWQELILF